MSVCYKCGLACDDCLCVIDLTAPQQDKVLSELESTYDGLNRIMGKLSISDTRITHLQRAREIIADIILQEVQ